MPRYKKNSYLRILREDGNIQKYKAVICECKCGNIIRCKKTLVTTGRKKSCGCISNEVEYVSKFIIRMYWTAFLSNAKIRKIQVDLKPEDLDEIIQGQNFICNLSGLPISLPKTANEFLLDRVWTASPDRIDSNKHYFRDNLQFVHKDINKMKMALDQNCFIEYCKAVAKNNS